MKTVTKPVCDNCGTVIMNPSDGFIFQGNVYVADVEDGGGLIGNAFPDPNEYGAINLKDIKEYCYCKPCVFDILNMGVDLAVKPQWDR